MADEPLSLSEYGCNKATRQFEEVTALYSKDMTPVYSGGLVYEFSQEESNYGLVKINGNDVSDLPDFAALQTAFSNTPAPSGDGGYKTSNSKSTCPGKSVTWLPANDDLPAIPAGAVKYMNTGAGKGPGLKGNNGNGSQNAGGASTATAQPGSGTASVTGTTATPTGATSTATKSSAATSVRIPEFSLAPLVCGLVVVLASMVGASLV